VTSLSTGLRDKHGTLTDEVNAAFDQLVCIVEKRRADIVQDLNAKELAKQETLAKQKDELEASLADLYTSCEFVEKALEHGSDTEILLVKKQVGDRLADYGEKMEVVRDPAENEYLVYLPGSPEEVENLMGRWSVVTSSSAICGKTCAVGGGMKKCLTGRPSYVTVTTRDWQGNVVLGPEIEQFFCEVVPVLLSGVNPGGGPIELTTELSDMEDGTYELTYVAPVEGQYELAVKMFGQHIKGSPFKITASTPPPDENNSVMSRKTSAAVSRTAGSVAAAQQRQRSKSHFHGQRPPPLPSGWAGAAARSANESQCSRNNPIEDDLVLKIGGRGRGKGEFTNPQGIAVTPNGEGRERSLLVTV
jgi:tripartite motif-containing protein 2/3